jgi:hypothetical protein
MAMKRATRRTHLQARDRLFWIALRRLWRNWRTAVVLMRPDTVVSWHRDWLRHRWTRGSTPRANGRPRVTREIRALVREIATANPLLGSATDPWRAAYPRRRRVRTHRVAFAETTPTSALADVADLPDESPRASRVDGLLHGPDAHGSGALRRGDAVPPSSAHPAFQHYGASHGRVVRATGGRGLSGRHGARAQSTPFLAWPLFVDTDVQVAARTHRDATWARCRVHYATASEDLNSVNRSVLANDTPQHGRVRPHLDTGGRQMLSMLDCRRSLTYFRPTTEQRYTSSVSTRRISGWGPAAAASIWSSEVNW